MPQCQCRPPTRVGPRRHIERTDTEWSRVCASRGDPDQRGWLYRGSRSMWRGVIPLLGWILSACGVDGHGQENYTVLPDTDFLGARSYSKGSSIDDCAAQCLARPDCVATSWNGPQSHFHNNFCNFDCKSDGRRALKGETAAIMLRRSSDLCSTPPPPPPPLPPPPPVPKDWQQRQATGWFLAGTSPPLSPYLCPTYGNGFLAATICPGGGGESTYGEVGCRLCPLTCGVERTLC
jgi:hypothetical protein